MTEYDFISNDWNSVELLFGEHLATETAYHEQMLRWSLRYARWWGLALLGDSDLVVSGSKSDYEVSLRACKAFTKHGRLVELSRGGEALTLQGSNEDRPDQLVPIYVGVSIEKQSFAAGASQSGAIDQRYLMRSRLKLAHEPESADYEWLQIGRMRRAGACFERDEYYIPHCMHINSHPAMRQITGDITLAAQDLIKAIYENTERAGEGSTAKAMAAAFISSIAPAAVILNGDMHPRAYLERLAIVIESQKTMLNLLETDRRDGAWKDAVALVGEARAFLTGERNDAVSGNGAQPGIGTSTRATMNTDADASRAAKSWWDHFNRVLIALRAIGTMFRGSMNLSTSVPKEQGVSTVTRGKIDDIVKKPPVR
jgi:hypothetical protein